MTLATSQHPDLILMDTSPGMDGYEATRRIKADPVLHHIPIIAVTSYALSGDDAQAFAAGCDLCGEALQSAGTPGQGT